jgi:type II secretory pathway component PulJ
MLALTLSALLLGILTAGMRMVVDEWQDSNNPFEDQLDISLVLLQIEQALAGSSPHSYIDQDTLEQNVFFVGGSDSLTWVSTVSPQARQQMTAWQLSADDRDGIVLKSTPAFADDPTERLEEATGTLVLPGMRLSLSYLTRDDLGRPEWLDEWIGYEYQLLPMAVRLEFADNERPGETLLQTVVPLLHRQHEDIQPVDIL